MTKPQAKARPGTPRMDAVLSAIMDGNWEIGAISAVTKLPPIQVLRQSAMLRKLGLIDRRSGGGALRLLPRFQASRDWPQSAPAHPAPSGRHITVAHIGEPDRRLA